MVLCQSLDVGGREGGRGGGICCPSSLRVEVGGWWLVVGGCRGFETNATESHFEFLLMGSNDHDDHIDVVHFESSRRL